MTKSVPLIRVFLSSPSDVISERKIALELIARFADRPSFRDRVAFRIIAWDRPGADTPMLASLTPQEAVNRGLPKPSECDIVIVLFWSRIGTPLNDADGQEYLSGTHWELMDGLKSPHTRTVVYRRTEPKSFAANDDAGRNQYLKLDELLKSELFYKDGKILRGINHYPTPDEFRSLFESHFEALVLNVLDDRAAAALDAGDVPAAPRFPSVRVWAQRSGAPPVTRDIQLQPRVNRASFQVGDSIRIAAQATQGGYLVLLNLGTSGNTTVLYPNTYEPVQPLERGRAYWFPNDQHQFEFVLSGPAGTEMIRGLMLDAPVWSLSASVEDNLAAAAPHIIAESVCYINVHEE